MRSPPRRHAATPVAAALAALLATATALAAAQASPAAEPPLAGAAQQAVAEPPPDAAGQEPAAAGQSPPEPAPPPPAAGGRLPDPVYQVWIDAEMDDDGVIRGRERLRWHNTSGTAVPDLRFHLYLNAFANDRSTFMLESGGQLRSDEFDQDRWGYEEVHSMTLPGGADLKAVEEFIAPDDGNPHDRTVARYPLPEPVPPGGWIEVAIEFESRLPDIFARTGIHGDFVLAGQWYPKIAVWEDAGVRGRPEPGWNAHQFHAHSEFYADFGDYDVTLTLPGRYRGKIGATGRQVEASAPLAGAGDAAGGGEAAAGTVTVRFVQDGVHDFAWTADPAFEVLRERFLPERDVPAAERERWAGILGVPERELELTPVEITLFLRPENRGLARRYLDSAKTAISGYGLRLGAYPYPTLTLVDPAWGGFGAGGMEYPTFITLAGHPLLAVPPFRGLRMPELVTVHEFGHQYFQGMIASNEFEEAWLDEGINSYYEMAVMEDDGTPVVELPAMMSATPFEFQRMSIAGGDFGDPLAAPAWRYRTGGSYAQSSYPRPAVTLRHLEGLLGPETFHRAMRSFFQRWQFGHPSTADFETSISAAAGADLDWFFRQALHSTRHLDYAVRRLRVQRIREPAGFFWRDGERVELEGEDEFGRESDGDGDRRWRSFAEVYRHGEFIHPVTVEFRFDDGTTLRREWSGEKRWARWTFRGPAKLVSAEVDPDGVLALDVDRLNNGKTREPDRAPALAIATDVLYWLASLFHAAALFA